MKPPALPAKVPSGADTDATGSAANASTAAGCAAPGASAAAPAPGHAAHAAISLTRQRAVLVFLAFAFAYFFSTLVRAVTATLAPVFSAELGLTAGQLGLLAGAYFLGFSVMQLPLGSALDRWGARRVLLVFLITAVLGQAWHQQTPA